jgi:glutaredoxin
MNYKITVFSGERCRPCVELKSFLDSMRLEYTVVDVHKEPELAEEHGISSIPVCYLSMEDEDEEEMHTDPDILIGFGEDQKDIIRKFAMKLYDTSKPMITGDYIPCL